jgi:Xaa-Pro aminopeptidase
MFQNFDVSSDPALGPPRVKALRLLMGRLGVHAVLVPRADEHQGEYVPANAERLAWLTGFTGSAGFAIVGLKTAALVTDGRYTLQSRTQVDLASFDILDSTTPEWIAWLGRQMSSGQVVGFDPKLHTAQSVTALTADFAKHGLKLKALAKNPVDVIWGAARPKPANGAVVVQPDALAGLSAGDKIARVQQSLKADRHDAAVLTLPDSIAWLLNIRGSDVAHNPVALAYAIVPQRGKVELFIAAEKIGSDVKKHLGTVAKIVAPDALGARLTELKRGNGARVRVDPATASLWIVTKLGNAAQHGADPCILPKARKTSAELDATRTAHIRDGAAVARFLAWLDAHAADGQVDEIMAAQKLEQCRSATNALKDISFDTISGSGPNGAIVHYRVNRQTNRTLKSGELFLIDSGGQYQDGTTDITRTVAIGSPSREMAERFTLVLKGHIALAMARFPVGTRGVQLDTLARMALWQAGLDFDHGTGHGVGSYLSVHEGPQSISKRGMAALEPGMIVSNEPGFYKEGAYGIRIENLLVVTAAQKISGGEREMLGFETITLAPIDRRLIAVALLEPRERNWLDQYHARVYKTLAPSMTGADKQWLNAATRPLVD